MNTHTAWHYSDTCRASDGARTSCPLSVSDVPVAGMWSGLASLGMHLNAQSGLEARAPVLQVSLKC